MQWLIIYKVDKFQFLLYVKCHNGPILIKINSTQQNVCFEPSVLQFI
jgi:hypothetical protein